MLTVGQIARRFELSRSTLLYYDSIGLLSPSERTGANYRLYSDADVRRLEQICTYRQAGLPLERIGAVLKAGDSAVAEQLELRFKALNEEINALRQQQCYIVLLLQRPRPQDRGGVVDMEALEHEMDRRGIDEAVRDRFHHDYETRCPDRHQALLEFLGLPEETIERVRASYGAAVRER